MTENELRATTLLAKYDRIRSEMRNVEKELHAACQAYGREQGYMGWYNKDTFRLYVNTKRERLEREAANKAA
jgi:hypothetical protein